MQKATPIILVLILAVSALILSLRSHGPAGYFRGGRDATPMAADFIRHRS